MSDFSQAMRAALAEAEKAIQHGDVPIGAVLVNGADEVVAADHNRREELNDPTAHAEILVLKAAGRALGTWRLADHTLVVTLEPCAMCAGAAVHARLDRIVYAAPDPKAGACWSLYNIPQDARLNHRVELEAGLMADAASALIRGFFSGRRT